MRHTKNLNLNLPDDNDPLEVSKLSENFEALDTRLGTGTEAIVSSMSVGDITYSTRNLEEESGGVLIACDQRTIDVDAYPDLPRNVLYWPYPELVFTDESATTVSRPCQLLGIPSDASTSKYIYTFAFYGTTGQRAAVYSIEDKKITVIPSGGPAQSYCLFRISDDTLISRLSAGISIFNNDLSTSDYSLDSNIKKLLSITSSAIARIGDQSFFIMSFMSGTSDPYPSGFYKTDDGFTTVQLVSSTENTSGFTVALFDCLNEYLREGTYYKAPFYPIQKKQTGEIVVLLKGSTNTAAYNASSETATRQNIDKIIPRVWETDSGITTISSRRLGGESLENWIFAKMSEHGSMVTVNLFLPIEGEYYVMHLSFGTNYYVITVNVDTSEVFPVKSDTLSNTLGSSDHINKNIYDKFRKKLICYNAPNNTQNILYLTDGTLEMNVSWKERVYNAIGQSGTPPNYMDTAISVVFSSAAYNPKDKRFFECGVSARADTMLMLIDKDIDATESFMRMYLAPRGTGYVPAQSGFCGGEFPANTSQSNLTEVNGDIYWANARSLYKLPKNKRQMPYIKNGYMKVLNEPEEGDEE